MSIVLARWTQYEVLNIVSGPLMGSIARMALMPERTPGQVDTGELIKLSRDRGEASAPSVIIFASS